MPQFSVAEATLRELTSPNVWERGRQYSRSGAVRALVRRGDRLEARVAGSEPEPYRVVIRLGGGEEPTFESGGCTCPYEWGYCKHVVAAFLTWQQAPDTVEERPSVEAQLAGLAAEQLRAIILRLIELGPALADAVELQLALTVSAGATPAVAELATSPAAPDGEQLNRGVQSALRSVARLRSADSGHRATGLDQFATLLDQLQEIGKAHGPAVILEPLKALTDEYVDAWSEIYNDLDYEEDDLHAAIAKTWFWALLAADLPPGQRELWLAALDEWGTAVDATGFGEPYFMALDALTAGWDAPAIRRLLAGEPPADAEWYEAPEFLAIRLEVLDRQGRVDDYLNFARASGQLGAYLARLARLGRVAEAIGQLDALATDAAAALALAQALDAAGQSDDALAVGLRGIGLEGPKLALGRWLADAGERAGQPETALAGVHAVLAEQPSLGEFHRARRLAGDRWPATREAVLQDVRRASAVWAAAAIEILIEEERIGDAVAIAKGLTWQPAVVARVAEAAVGTDPEWVIQTCQQQAETIMDAGRSAEYGYAAEWVARARPAFRAARQPGEWEAWVDGLLQQHARKYKLVPLLQAALQQ